MHDQRVYMLCMGIFSFNQRVVDIGLSSRSRASVRAFSQWVLAIGTAWLLMRNGPLSIRLVPQIILVRYGIGSRCRG